MSDHTVTVELELTRLQCSECAVVQFAPAKFVQHRRDDHKSFYCLNGHPQHFPQQTEAERLRAQLHAAELEKTRLTNERLAAMKQLDKAAAELKRHKTRSAAGVCPCCKRTFKQLAAHMKNKHPEVKP